MKLLGTTQKWDTKDAFFKKILIPLLEESLKET